MRVHAQRVVAQSSGLFLALTLALFPAAATLSWLVGWLYVLLFFGFFLGVNAWLYPHNPGLLQERLSLSRVAGINDFFRCCWFFPWHGWY